MMTSGVTLASFAMFGHFDDRWMKPEGGIILRLACHVACKTEKDSIIRPPGLDGDPGARTKWTVDLPEMSLNRKLQPCRISIALLQQLANLILPKMLTIGHSYCFAFMRIIF